MGLYDVLIRVLYYLQPYKYLPLYYYAAINIYTIIVYTYE